MSIKFDGISPSLATHVATNGQRSRETDNKHPSTGSLSSISSTSVTLSSEAMSLARLSAKGIRVSTGQLVAPLAEGDGPAASAPLPYQKSRPISEDELTSLLMKMGADKETTATLILSLDYDQDRQISEAEIMRGLSEAGSDKTSKFAETLRRFMDAKGDGSGSVSGREFMAIASNLYAALKQ